MNQSTAESIRDVECVESSSTIKQSFTSSTAPGEDDTNVHKDLRRIAGPFDIFLMSKLIISRPLIYLMFFTTHLYFVQISVLCCRM